MVFLLFELPIFPKIGMSLDETPNVGFSKRPPKACPRNRLRLGIRSKA
jgi:hypothetical protein